MRKLRLSKVDKAIRELESLLNDFDSHDREEMKTRADVLTSTLLETGLIERWPDDYLLGLDDVVKSLGMKSRKMAEYAASFYAALSSYEDDYGAVEDALVSLQEFG